MSADSPASVPPRRDRVATAVAAAVIVTGVVIVISWHAHLPGVLQVLPGLPAMQYNTAVGFIMAGLAILACSNGQPRVARVLSVGIAALGWLTASQDVFGWNLGIDEALFIDTLRQAGVVPGRMARTTGLCFGLLGLAGAFRTTRWSADRPVFAAIPAGLVVAVSSLSLFGHAAGLVGAPVWSTYSRMAVHTAVGLLALGFATLRGTWIESRRKDSAIPNWAPVTALLVGIFASTVLGFGIWAKQRLEIQRTTNTVAQGVQRHIAANVVDCVRALERLARRCAVSAGLEDGLWSADVQALLGDFPAFQTIEWMDDDLVIRRANPDVRHEDGTTLEPERGERRLEALVAARENRAPAFTRPIDLEQRERGFAVYVPIFDVRDTFGGLIVGVINIQELFSEILSADVAPGYVISITQGGDLVFEYGGGAVGPRGIQSQENFRHYGADWRVSVAPGPSLLRELRTPLPFVTLLIGLTASALLGYLLSVSRRAQRVATEYSLVNARLGQEIGERIRMEAHVHAALAHVQRQKFALDEHAIVSMTDVRGMITYANDRFCAISGYSREELLGQNHRIIKSSEHPPEFFSGMYRTISSGGVWKGELCNRAKDGQVYWVNATIVPFLGAHGKPEQYIAIRTDITARKVAEQKLRDALCLSEASLGVISRVAGSPAMAQGDVTALAQIVTELSAAAIDAERTGVWLFDAEAATATCLDLFQLSSARHSAGYTLQSDDFGPGLAALDTAQYVDVHDALSDPRTAGYAERYFRPNGITSILAVAIRTGGRKLGLLCFEHVGRAHRWEPREISFGCQVADQIGIAILTRERSLAAEELIRARDAAEAATRAKSDFLAMMSHEIRTPLNGVLGMNNLLLEGMQDARQRQIASSINSSAESLLTIINDILDFSKIEARKLELEHIDFDLRAVLDEALEIQATRAHAKGLELAGMIDPASESLVRGDPGRVRQVLCNLVGNAVKFTERGEVIVRAFAVEETSTHLCIRFEIRDTGIGLSPEAQERLFQAFVQADRSTTRRFGGTGLGLVISRQLVEMMGGEIGVSSESGRGSTFHFTLRLEKQFAAATRMGLTARNLDGGMPRRVLVVEDNMSSRAMLCEQLEAWHIMPERVAAAREALERLRQAAVMGGRFCTVIADLGLPGIDGLALARDMGRDPLLSGTRVILLVPLGSGREAPAIDGIHLVAVAKPIKADELWNALQNRDGAVQPAATSAGVPDQPGRGVRVLLAEDNAINQMVAAGSLNKFGCTTDVAANGLEVLEALRRAHYDLIFMDCMMPEMDGFETTLRLRELEKAEGRPHIYIVALTANAMVGDRERCLKAGMNDYVSKPMRQNDVRAALERWRARAEANLERVPERV